MNKNIVFITLTPLAGAPFALFRAIKTYTDFSARLINFSSDAYQNRTYSEDLIWQKDKEECIEAIKNADILHFHHYIDLENNKFEINFNEIIKPNCKIVKQFHTNRDFVQKRRECFKNQYEKDKSNKIVVAHCAERTFLDLEAFPNIIPIREPLLMPKETNNKKVKVVFSASRKNSIFDDRWETKGFFEVDCALKKLSGKLDFDYEVIFGVAYQKALEIKQNADIIVGDIVTGSYHLTELEGLSQGKAVLSNFDSRTTLNCINTLNCSDIPFVNTSLDTLEPVLKKLVNDSFLRREIGAFSRKWIEKYYDDKILIKKYEEFYNKVLKNETVLRKDSSEFRRAKEFLYNEIYNYSWEIKKSVEKEKEEEAPKENKNLLQNIFSITNELKNGKKRKIINILGLKFKFRVKNRFKSGKYKIINKGENNQIFLLSENGEMTPLDKKSPLKIEIFGNNNTVIIPRGAIWHDCQIIIRSNNSRFEMRHTNMLLTFCAHMSKGENQEIFIDEDLSVGGGLFLTTGDDAAISIGRDCMFATDTCLLSGDGHPIKDKTTGEIINSSKGGIKIGNHVWFGKYAKALKGADIPDNCIVGMGSLVNKKFDEQNSIIAGVSAKIVKTNIEWQRK